MAVKKRRYWRWVLNGLVFLMVVLLIYFAWDDIVEAWWLLPSLNIWILLLLIPAQILSYFAGGMMFWTYLQGRGQLKQYKLQEAAKVALELNFLNHIFPSGGVSGVTYVIWRLGQLGVVKGQAIMSQAVRFLATLLAFLVLLVISVVMVTIENTADSWLIFMVAAAITAVAFLVLFASYLIGSENRLVSFSRWLAKLSNKFVQKISLGKIKKEVLPVDRVVHHVSELHKDYLALKADKKLLLKPLIWGFVFVLADVALFAVAFLALGAEFNPALLVIAYGAATVIGAVMVTPGGAGGYEAIMVMVLVAGGMATAMATSGVILARVILILGTLATGYVFYHLAMKKFGQPMTEEKGKN